MLTLKSNTQLVGAEFDGSNIDYGSSVVPVYDDGGDRLFVVSDACGNFGYCARVIRCDSMESAYGIHLDESPTVPIDEIWETVAWSIPDSRDRWGQPIKASLADMPWGRDCTTRNCRTSRIAQFKATGEVFQSGEAMELDLVEGFERQDNSSGSGVVNVGHYLHITEIGAEWLRESGLRLKIRAYDWEPLDELVPDVFRLECGIRIPLSDDRYLAVWVSPDAPEGSALLFQYCYSDSRVIYQEDRSELIGLSGSDLAEFVAHCESGRLD